MQIGVSITLAFSVYKLRLSDDVPVQSDIIPLINIYFISCMFFSLSAMVWFSLKNIMIENQKCPTKLKYFVQHILWHIMFLKYKYRTIKHKNHEQNNNNNIDTQKNILKSSKSMPLKFKNSKLSCDYHDENDALYEDLNVYNQKSPTSIPLYEIDQRGKRSLISRDNSSDLESNFYKENNVNQTDILKKSMKSKIFKKNIEEKLKKLNFEQIDEKKKFLDDFEKIKVINQFIFVLYLIYFLVLNLLCLFILPFYFKKSLSIND